MSVRDPSRFTRDLWLYDTKDGRGQRLTFDPADEFAPVWSPDGRRLLFSAMAKGLVNLRLMEVTPRGRVGACRGRTRSASAALRRTGPVMGARSCMSPAAVQSRGAISGLLRSLIPGRRTRCWTPVSSKPTGASHPTGRWVAYASNEGGQLEVYVDRFPERDAKRLVSTGGGGWPRWARDGSEIFYLSPDNRLMTAAVQINGDTLDVAAPRPLFTLRPRPPARLDAYPYDVSPDGRRFVVNSLVDDTGSAVITLVFNWTTGLTSRR